MRDPFLFFPIHGIVRGDVSERGLFLFVVIRDVCDVFLMLVLILRQSSLKTGRFVLALGRLPRYHVPVSRSNPFR